MQKALSPNHKRSLSVTSKAVEKTINDLEILLKGTNQNQITETLKRVYTEKDKKKIYTLLDDLREVNEEMFESLELKSQKLSEDRIVYANLTYLWTILIDSKSDKLKRYGEVHKENKKIVDNYMNRLLSIVEKLKEVSA